MKIKTILAIHNIFFLLYFFEERPLFFWFFQKKCGRRSFNKFAVCGVRLRWAFVIIFCRVFTNLSMLLFLCVLISLFFISYKNEKSAEIFKGVKCHQKKTLDFYNQKTISCCAFLRFNHFSFWICWQKTKKIFLCE